MSSNSRTAAFFSFTSKSEKGFLWGLLGWFVILTLLVLILKNYQEKLTKTTVNSDLYFSNGVVLKKIPTAKTLEQQHRGLSQKTTINKGMLFSWDQPAQRVFWMKDTFVPLTVGFFDNNGVLFQIQNMQPNSKEYYFSVKPAIDALELPQGQFEKFNLTVGIRLIEKIIIENK